MLASTSIIFLEITINPQLSIDLVYTGFYIYLSKKCVILGTKNDKKNENLWFFNSFENTVLKTTDIQVSKNSTLHHKISGVGGGGLLQKLSVKFSSNIRYTIA